VKGNGKESTAKIPSFCRADRSGLLFNSERKKEDVKGKTSIQYHFGKKKSFKAVPKNSESLPGKSWESLNIRERDRLEVDKG